MLAQINLALPSKETCLNFENKLVPASLTLQLYESS